IASLLVVSLPRVPGAPRVRAGPSHRHARRAAGDRGPWVSLPLRATIPEGNTVGQQSAHRIERSHRAPGLRAPGLIRAEMGTITPSQASQTASDHRKTRTAAGPRVQSRRKLPTRAPSPESTLGSRLDAPRLTPYLPGMTD